MQEWSKDWRWRQRASAWDAHQDKVSCDAVIEARKAAATDMVNRHLLVSGHLQSLASVELLRWLHALGIDEASPDLRRTPQLTPKAIQELLDYAIKLERLNRDEPESIVERREKKQSPEEVEAAIKHLLGAREGVL